MPSPKFPASGTILDGKIVPIEKFDALFGKITQERQVVDGYFLQCHPEEARLLFVVNGAPYAAGALRDAETSFLEIHEFFAAYAERPESPLSFCLGDKRLLLGLMVLFRHQPARQEVTDAAGAAELLKETAGRGVDAILGIRAGDDWSVGICGKGRLVAVYLPVGVEAAPGLPPAEQLTRYLAHADGEVAIAVFEETRVGPAEDVTLFTPETRGRLAEVFLKVAARVEEAEAAPAPAPAPEPAADAILELAEPAAPPPPSRPPAPPSPVEGLVEKTLTTGVPAPAVPPRPASAPAFKGPVPEIVLFAGEKQLATYTLASGELTIGRTAGNSILLENPGVSRRHAVIRADGERVIIEDLGSANGTFINGQKVGSQELKDGDEIQIVKHRLVYRVPREAEAPKKAAPAMDAGKTMMIDSSAMAAAMAGKGAPAPPRADTAATPILRPRLILPDLKKFALEEEEVAIGSGGDCQIQVSGMFVAKVHARIVPADKGQYKLIHLGGLAGTRVNGERVSEHLLKHGDEIEIGGKRILFRLER